MDYIYGELNREITVEPYGRCYYWESNGLDWSIINECETIPLQYSFDTDGQSLFYNIIEGGSPKYEYFAYPKPYGLLTSINRNGIEDLSNWLVTEVPGQTPGSPRIVLDKDDTIYYLYRTSSKISIDSLVTFKV